jgi:general L-amino acid transport system substrate-binding protein
MVKTLATLLTILSLWLAGSAQAGSPTLNEVRARGTLLCGVMAPSIGMESIAGPRGFFADFCHATAAAVLGSPSAVVFVELEASQWFKAVSQGEVDVVMAPVTWTRERGLVPGVEFATTYFYSGPGVIAHRYLGYANLGDARNARVCVQKETTSDDWLAHRMGADVSSMTKVRFQSNDGRWRAFMQRQCDLMVSDQMLLAAGARQQSNPDNYVIFPDTLTIEPQGPLVRSGDRLWRDIVAWTIHATVHAERLGITAAIAARPSGPLTRDRDLLLGLTPGVGSPLGLDDRWAARVIQAVGNYGEIFNRNLTVPFGISRGPNALWTNGGLMMAPLLR